MDETGRHFDASGIKAHWWPKKLEEIFRNKSRCFSKEYVNEFVNNDGILSENIADHGGLMASIRAFELDQHQKSDDYQVEKLPGLEFLTSKQLLLLGYGKSFCSNTKSKAREWQRKTDIHSPSHERINLAIKHLPMFKDIYQCSPESKLVNIKKQNKCNLW